MSAPVPPEILARCVDIFDQTRKRYGATAAMARAFEYATGPTKVRRRIEADANALEPAAVAVIESVARYHGMPVEQMRVASVRSWAARAEAVYLVRATLGVSFPRLAKFFGRDHTSILSCAERFKARLAVDDVLRERMRQFVAGCRGEAAVAGEERAA